MAALSPEEIAGLKFMREEEKLAHDVYVALYSVWGANVFSQIAVSETTHTETILALLVKYGIADPAAGKAPGVFEDPALQSLYNTLVAMGQPSLIDALKVGALIEETDIHDINERKAVTDETDILRVYTSLLCGSRNHLRAFNGQLLAQKASPMCPRSSPRPSGTPLPMPPARPAAVEASPHGQGAMIGGGFRPTQTPPRPRETPMPDLSCGVKKEVHS